jgi:hypothetical protein
MIHYLSLSSDQYRKVELLWSKNRFTIQAEIVSASVAML